MHVKTPWQWLHTRVLSAVYYRPILNPILYAFYRLVGYSKQQADDLMVLNLDI